ncbi:MAG: phage holin family protein [Patescibacteria group bacterium]|nr:phage holin family protein [Patescibacteria group bacterium]
MGILISWVVSALVIFSIAYVLPGVHVAGFTTALVVALILGIINAFLKPILIILTLPINILTLGLFTFVINAALILLVSSLVPGFIVDGFLWALVFGIILSIANAFVHSLYR